MVPDSDNLKPATERLRITEIFQSLQGEARTVGLPTTFIRLTGCPLRCVYCDTTYAFSGGSWYTLEAIMEQVNGLNAQHVTVTGGEPLAQQACLPLLVKLCDAGYQVSLETSGAMDIAAVDKRVSRVMDLKTPSSGEQARNLMKNLDQLTPHDQVKFVISDRNDFDWSVQQIERYGLQKQTEVLMSPVHGLLAPVQLADWILESGLQIRFQMQLHKLLWGDEPGR